MADTPEIGYSLYSKQQYCIKNVKIFRNKRIFWEICYKQSFAQGNNVSYFYFVWGSLVFHLRSW